MALETLTGGIAFLLARFLFGGVMAVMGLNHFMDADAMTGYAEQKRVPAPRLSVLSSGALLIGGGLGIAAGLFPIIAAGAVAVFLLIATPLMHDFWTHEDPGERQAEMTNFLKNAALLGGALALVAIGGTAWPFALDLGLF